MFGISDPRTRAMTRAVLRLVMAGYLGYLGVSIIRTIGTEESSMPPWLAYLSGIVFVLIAVGFAVYVIIDTRRAIKEIDTESSMPADETEELPSAVQELKDAEENRDRQ